MSEFDHGAYKTDRRINRIPRRFEDRSAQQNGAAPTELVQDVTGEFYTRPAAAPSDNVGEIVARMMRVYAAMLAKGKS